MLVFPNRLFLINFSCHFLHIQQNAAPFCLRGGVFTSQKKDVYKRQRQRMATTPKIPMMRTPIWPRGTGSSVSATGSRSRVMSVSYTHLNLIVVKSYDMAVRLIWAGFMFSSQSALFIILGWTDITQQDRKSTRLNSSHSDRSRMPSSA